MSLFITLLTSFTSIYNTRVKFDRAAGFDGRRFILCSDLFFGGALLVE